MRRTTIYAALLALLTGSSAACAGQYDFFELSRYPEGGKLKPGVELYEVKEGGGAPQEYGRRVVRWWPRKGVDIIDVQDGLIEREWTRAPDMLEQEERLDTEPEIEVQDKVEFKPRRENGKPIPHFLRRIRGYLHPPEDGDYRVMISADTMGFFFVSADEKPENKELRASLTAYSRYWQFDKFPTQISKPIPMKKGRKYYYEIIHKQDGSGNHLEASWEGDKMPRMAVGPEYVSTLNGEPGKVKAQWWRTRDAGAVRAMDLPRTFKAHLIGFDGAGNEVGYPDPEKDFAAPNVILRMADGSKQSIPGGNFCRKDQEFIMDVYTKEMKRVRATLDKTVYSVNPRTRKEFPGGTPIGQPGSWLKQSEHMVVPSGSQGKNSPWINEENPEMGARYRDSIFSSYENLHAYLEYGGHLMPYWDRKEQYKYEGRTGGTILNGYQPVKSGPGGGYGGQGLIPDVAPGGGFAHEYGHGFSLQWNSAHSGEILATATADIVGGGVWSDNSIQRPWRNCLHASYTTTFFYRFVGTDPNWGLCAMAAVPMAAGESSFFQTLARVGQQRGMFKDGIRGVGDIVGDYGARLAEFDCQFREHLRTTYFAAARSYLEPVDVEKGIYRIPWDEAPEPFGVNIVRLVPQGGEEVIEVDFQGYHDPAVYGDWRACIVAVDKDGASRYSNLWNKGVMQMPRREGDRRYWLTVAATPSALMQNGVSTTSEGHFAPRYPWQVTLRGAVPGTPRPLRTDLDDVYCAYGPGLRSGTIVPAIANNEQVNAFIEKARAYRDEMMARMKSAKSQVQEINCLQMVGRAKEALSAIDGAPHPNGGGWVVAGAQVAPTAYVGPHALVLGEAKVRDHAIIEDGAVLMNAVEVSGHARVSGQAVLEEGVKLGGYQRIWHSMRQPADAETPELTSRYGSALDENGLWANYAMDQDEALMLEDYYRGRDSSGNAFSLLLNGYLYGRPTFVEDGTRRGFAFDGKTQYAELNRHIADLGELTVDMTVKRLGSGDQTLLDCGSGMDNRFTLITSSSGGRPAFTALVDGKRVAEVTSVAAIEKDVWTRLRLEIDGTKIAIWINDKPAGETKSAFRPADVFKPGKAQRNFIAAAFDGGAKFHGVFDNVVVYHQVHGSGFANLPSPMRDAPRRPCKGFALNALKSMGVSPYEQSIRKQEIVQKATDYWDDIAAAALVQLTELKLSVPEYVEAVKKADEFEQWKNNTGEDFKKAYYQTKDAAPKAAEIDQIGQKIKALNEKMKAMPKRQAKKESGKTRQAPPSESASGSLELAETIKSLEAKLAELEAFEKQALAVVDAMPESKAAKDEIARLEKELKASGNAQEQKLKKAQADDELLKAFTVARAHIKYAREHDRVLRAYGGIKGPSTSRIREDLKSSDPEFRKWSDTTGRLGQLRHEELCRMHNYLLQQTDSPALLEQIHGVKKALSRAKQDMQAGQQKDALGAFEAMDPDLAALTGERQALETRAKELATELKAGEGPYIEEKMRGTGLNEKMTENEERLKKAAEAVGRKYPIEYHTLCSFLRQNFHGFYNGPISMYIDEYARRVVGGDSMRDRPDQVEKIEELYAPDNWKTRVDQWDWRTRWEIDGSIKDLPLTQKWLERVRGTPRHLPDVGRRPG